MANIAWAAGLFEGEGTISYGKIITRKDSIRTQLSMGTVDKDVLQKFINVVERGKVLGPRFQRDNKPFYYWNVSNMADCLFILGQFYPYFGNRRKERADEMIDAILKRYE